MSIRVSVQVSPGRKAPVAIRAVYVKPTARTGGRIRAEPLWQTYPKPRSVTIGEYPEMAPGMENSTENAYIMALVAFCKKYQMGGKFTVGAARDGFVFVPVTDHTPVVTVSNSEASAKDNRRRPAARRARR